MSVEIRVPQLGESIVEATVTRWLKRQGDPVRMGEQVVELETDKVNLPVEAEQAGVIESILRAEGDTVGVGEVIGRIAEATAPTPRAGEEEPAAAGAAEPVAQSVGAEQGNGRAAIQATPVARMAAEANQLDLAQISGTGARGKVTKEDVQSFLEAPTPAPPPRTGEGGPSGGSPPPPAPPPRTGEGGLSGGSPPPPAPPPRTGEGGLSGGLAPAPLVPTTTPLAIQPAPAAPAPIPADRREERVRMSRRRKTIAERLVLSKQSTAMLTTFNEVDMTRILEVRSRRKDSFKERHGVGLGFMSFFVKATVGALKRFPMLNAEIDGDTVIVKHYYDVGIAVVSEQGLIVPVVRDADGKTFAEIEREVLDLGTRGRAGALTLAELQGGTFTITNGGVYGSLMSTPILNFPQVGILGMHKIEERPVVVKGEIVVRPMMYLAFSYDHRIVDGTDAVRFLVTIKELIEDPEALLLEG